MRGYRVLRGGSCDDVTRWFLRTPSRDWAIPSNKVRDPAVVESAKQIAKKPIPETILPRPPTRNVCGGGGGVPRPPHDKRLSKDKWPEQKLVTCDFASSYEEASTGGEFLHRDIRTGKRL